MKTKELLDKLDVEVEKETSKSIEELSEALSFND